MDAKKNLTQVQRVMLDKLYTRQFRIMRDESDEIRQKQLDKICADLIAKTEKQPEIANIIKLRDAFNGALAKFDRKALYQSGMSVRIDEAKFMVGHCHQYGYYSDQCVSGDSPEVLAFNAVSKKIHDNMDKAECEMRLRIHGSELTYAEIEAEIKAILKGVTL